VLVGSLGVLSHTVRLQLSRVLKKCAQIVSPKQYRVANPKDDPYGFRGWGLNTKHSNPWGLLGGEHPTDKVGAAFRLADENLRTSIRQGTFELSQFELSAQSPREHIDKVLNNLLWRHYIVFISARLALGASMESAEKTHNYVEVGVCDGLTAFFAISGSEGLADPSRRHFFLLDSWGPMRPEDFAPGDKQKIGSYSFLRRERTEENLRPWSSLLTYVQGYVPETLSDPALPASMSWLHIDLNSSLTTAASLDLLAQRIAEGGICLFDDYGWGAYSSTKRAVDEYFRTRSDGTLLALPTGQSLWIRHRGLSPSCP